MKTSVLTIDDSRTIRTLLRQTLEEAGFEVHAAEDGVDGVAKYAVVQPDVVVTDINMPKLDGFGVIERLRGPDFESAVPILVLTTENSMELKERARRLGATGWIVKPFDDAMIVSLLRRVTGHG